MSLIRKNFNATYLEFLEFLHKSFSDVKELSSEVEYAAKKIKKDEANHKLHSRFAKGLDSKKVDRIFANDETLAAELPFFVKIGLSSFLGRMVEDEKKVFWKRVKSLVKYSSMMNACGEKLGAMQEIAENWTKKNADVAPGELHSKILTDILSGGEMSKSLMDFMNPETLTNMIKNASVLLLNENGKESIAGMTEMLNSISTEDIKEFTDEARKNKEKVEEVE